MDGGRGTHGAEPFTLERLQTEYTADERRAIHDATVNAVPSCHDLVELASPSFNGNEQVADRIKSRQEILAELRDMKRRRTKYRVASKSRNYSDVLRDVIKTQMEHYSEVHTPIPHPELSPERNIRKDITDNHTKPDKFYIKEEPHNNYSSESSNQKRGEFRKRYNSKDRNEYDITIKRSKYRDRSHNYSSSSRNRSRDNDRSRISSTNDDLIDRSGKYRSSRNNSRHSKEDNFHKGGSRSSKDKRKNYEDKDQRDKCKKSHDGRRVDNGIKHTRYYDTYNMKTEYGDVKMRIKTEREPSF